MQEVINKILIDLGISPLRALFLGALIAFIATRIFGHIIDDFWVFCKNYRIDKKFIWVPDSPIKNNGIFKNINDYPKDIEWDIENNRLKDNLVSGEKSFKQQLAKFVYTERGKYVIYPEDYGNEQAETIFIERNPEEFKRQCRYMIETVMNHENFKYYIQELYKVERKGQDLYLEMKVHGKPDTLRCKVPHIKVKEKDKNNV